MAAIDWIGQLAPAVATLGAAALGLTRGQRRLRTNLRHDLETWKDLPAESHARVQLMTHIEWQIDRLRQAEAYGRRDWSGATLGAIFAVGFGYLTVWLFSQDDWWRWFGVPCALFAALGLYGISDGLTLKERPPTKRPNRSNN